MKKILLLLFCSVSAFANVSLPSILNSNMVLQQQTELVLWGWADPTEKITVSASWASAPVSTTCANDAVWKVSLQTPKAGGPYTITIQGHNKIELTNILIGEVWLCSGQSNMEMTAAGGVKDALAEAPTANYPNIRFFKVSRRAAETAQVDVRGNWTVCDSATMKHISAVGYFFGKKLQNTLNVPIGLIDASWGGSFMDSWVPETLAMLYPETRRSALAMPKAPWAPNKAGVLYNGMIAPLTAFPIAGVIWYQGEANRHDAPAYYKLTHTLVDAWRGLWQKELPFYYVQIAPFTYGDKFQTAATRESQTRAMDIPKSGMIVTTDLVDNLKDIHPAYKKEVGNRLANWALAETYGQKVGLYKSPQYRSMVVEGAKIRLTFDNAPNGLVVKGSEVTELEIAGADGVFSKAQARIKGNTLEVWSEAVKNPVAVRFAFRDAPVPNLFSKEGLPVIPFRTDAWDLGVMPVVKP
ncbi:sialate O-acetylesterase [Larkinella arboricola]|uniref:Sialate O-acetylesterase n=1 Tax=Larkinella arboricola TaxID=643671 RepID=A0A327X3E4_LARAB|nr:sialate O-acetylesterase [Larkinella arboricola]RAK00199.1 sialate O-acetylesterase [Larkinella arboricola]